MQSIQFSFYSMRAPSETIALQTPPPPERKPPTPENSFADIEKQAHTPTDETHKKAVSSSRGFLLISYRFVRSLVPFMPSIYNAVSIASTNLREGCLLAKNPIRTAAVSRRWFDNKNPGRPWERSGLASARSGMLGAQSNCSAHARTIAACTLRDRPRGQISGKVECTPLCFQL